MEEIASLSEIPITLTLLPEEGENKWRGSEINKHYTTFGYSTYIYFKDEVKCPYV